MSKKKLNEAVTEIVVEASDGETDVVVEVTEPTTAAPAPYIPFSSQAAIDAYEDFQVNPNKVFEFYLNEINIDHSLNGRRNVRSATDEDIVRMAADIKRNGIIQPVVGWFETETNFAYVGAGYGRCIALELANASLAPSELPIMLRVVFDQSVVTKSQALAINIAENVQRKNLNTMDMADGMKRMKDDGKTGQEIAEAFGMKSKAGVTGYLSLLKLPEYVQQKIVEGTLSFRNGLELVALMKTAPEAVEKTAKKWVEKAELAGAPPSAAESRVDTADAGGRLPPAPMSYKELKEIVTGTTGPGEDARVSVVNIVLAALFNGTNEKEHGIGKVTPKNYAKKLVEVLDKVSTVKSSGAAKGKAA
jgi:ParB/RepB/Spo0J family partition protein